MLKDVKVQTKNCLTKFRYCKKVTFVNMCSKSLFVRYIISGNIMLYFFRFLQYFG